MNIVFAGTAAALMERCALLTGLPALLPQLSGELLPAIVMACGCSSYCIRCRAPNWVPCCSMANKCGPGALVMLQPLIEV